jgi:hypothetical protein
MKNIKAKASEAVAFLLGSAISAVTVLGALGIDPFVSGNTEQICKDYKVESVSCRQR